MDSPYIDYRTVNAGETETGVQDFMEIYHAEATKGNGTGIPFRIEVIKERIPNTWLYSHGKPVTGQLTPSGTTEARNRDTTAEEVS